MTRKLIEKEFVRHEPADLFPKVKDQNCTRLASRHDRNGAKVGSLLCALGEGLREEFWASIEKDPRA